MSPVTVCDDKVSYYPTTRNFKITMNMLRNQSDSTVFDPIHWMFACLCTSHTTCVWFCVVMHTYSHMDLCTCLSFDRHCIIVLFPAEWENWTCVFLCHWIFIEFSGSLCGHQVWKLFLHSALNFSSWRVKKQLKAVKSNSSNSHQHSSQSCCYKRLLFRQFSCLLSGDEHRFINANILTPWLLR